MPIRCYRTRRNTMLKVIVEECLNVTGSPGQVRWMGLPTTPDDMPQCGHCHVWNEQCFECNPLFEVETR